MESGMTQEKMKLEQEQPVQEQLSSKKEYDDEMTIVLWKNEKSTDDNNQPSVRGQCTINGVKYYISCWTLVDKNKKSFLRGKIQKAGELTNQGKNDLF
jgi:hypothetical protein